ncbi:methyltransferase domain-containing protein [Kitasatospora acidiphila]|uniref:Methyltransferase domain-containing protein n=1 Tax=Kitasatospora acidiphila TaxID=2567942 RepID=A0A540W197_9ACTN|nr:class I SAM-dependent methyltransferase [Kitasatospora acidiphila]TQF02795.1 methyltransferase domain-containing protein [Kitasatospora acidiphila]
MTRTAADWAAYLDVFHQAHPGITEAVLRRAHADGTTPYQWLAETVPAGGVLLDLACGSAPMCAVLPPAVRYLGVDRSSAELAAARTADVGPLLRADATALPLASGSIDTVVCSMALMLLTPLPRALREIRRVLRRGGLLVATVPATGPLRAGDYALAAALLLAIRRTLRYPNDRAMRHLPAALARAGLELRSDERRCFTLPLTRPDDGSLLLDSLYLPGLTPTAHRRALRVLRAAHRTEVPIPLRRITARAR